MSIVTLKRKTQTQYNNMSVGRAGFSLNGTRRSAGYVGQDTLGRSLIRSLSRNGALKGHGGCCGKYPVKEIKMSPEMAGLNNPAVVKSASLTTSGLLMTKYRWIRRPQPYSATKSDDTKNINDQSSYIEYIAKKAISDASSCNIVGDNKVVKTCDGKCPLIVKPATETGAISASEYIRKLNRCFGVNYRAGLATRTIKSIPFACTNSTFA